VYDQVWAAIHQGMHVDEMLVQLPALNGMNMKVLLRLVLKLQAGGPVESSVRNAKNQRFSTEGAIKRSSV